MIDDYECGAVGGMSDKGNRSTRRKPVTASLCSPQIPHEPDVGSNPGLRGVKPATNRLSYCTAITEFFALLVVFRIYFRVR
jgi:hypothetical protein